jgi:hypothetical protein
MKIRRSILLFCAVIVALMVLLVWLTKKPSQSVAPSGETETASAPTAERAETKPSQREPHLAARSNAPQSGTVAPANVPSPPTQTKAERAKEALALLNNENVVLYGKVTDQFDAPVAGAEISGSIQVNDGTRVGADQIRLVTDNNGMFTISGYTGKALGIAVKKPGYVMATTNTRFVFSRLWSEAEQHNPDPNHPTVIKMWKLQGAEPLAGIDQRHKFPYTDTPVSFDLLAGKIVASGGDIKITVSRSEGVVSEQTLQDWSVRVEAVDGGVLRADATGARVIYVLPEGGYQPSDTFILSTNAPHRWAGSIEQMYFVRSRGGQVYSKLNVGLAINRNPANPVWVEFRGAANANGSRNFEADAPNPSATVAK